MIFSSKGSGGNLRLQEVRKEPAHSGPYRTTIKLKNLFKNKQGANGGTLTFGGICSLVVLYLQNIMLTRYLEVTQFVPDNYLVPTLYLKGAYLVCTFYLPLIPDIYLVHSQYLKSSYQLCTFYIALQYLFLVSKFYYNFL